MTIENDIETTKSMTKIVNQMTQLHRLLGMLSERLDIQTERLNAQGKRILELQTQSHGGSDVKENIKINADSKP